MACLVPGSSQAGALHDVARGVGLWEWLTDDVLRLDVAEYCANDICYFPFDEIVEAMNLLARSEGVFAEPAAAASVAGLKRAITEELLPSEALTVALITGHGLKDSSALSPKWDEPKLVAKMGDLP